MPPVATPPRLRSLGMPPANRPPNCGGASVPVEPLCRASLLLRPRGTAGAEGADEFMRGTGGAPMTAGAFGVAATTGPERSFVTAFLRRMPLVMSAFRLF